MSMTGRLLSVFAKRGGGADCFIVNTGIKKLVRTGLDNVKIISL